MAYGRRCDAGCESWPDSTTYAQCAACGGQTFRFKNLSPLSDEEARSKVNHLDFEKFYEDHCEQRGISVDGPLEPTPGMHRRWPAPSA